MTDLDERLRGIDRVGPPDLWEVAKAKSANGATSTTHRSSSKRIATIGAALVISFAALAFAVLAFRPNQPSVPTMDGSPSPTPPPGMSVYTDPLGWTAFYPSQWSVSTLRPSDGLGTGVRIQNLAYLQTSPLDNGVVLTITRPIGATPDPTAGSSSFPLTTADFKVVPGPGGHLYLGFRIDGVRYAAALHIGLAASKADVAAMDEVIVSIRPPSSTSTSSDEAVFIAVDPTIPNMYMQALFKGPIVVRDGCVLMGGVSGSASLPIWPYGSTAVEDSGHVVIKDASGNIIASEGQEISMGGGYVAEFQPADKVMPKDYQVTKLEQSLGYTIPDRCLAGIYGVWQVGQIETAASTQTGTPSPVLSDALVGTQWMLTSIDGRPWPVHGMNRVSLLFDSSHPDRLGGYNGCNEYGARWAMGARDLALNGRQQLHVTHYGQTLRGCVGKGGWVEKRFGNVLQSDPTARLATNQLRLTSPEGILVFSPV